MTYICCSPTFTLVGAAMEGFRVFMNNPRDLSCKVPEDHSKNYRSSCRSDHETSDRRGIDDCF